jgi:hypothetical protein
MENGPPPHDPTPGPAVKPGRPMIQTVIVIAGAIFVLLLVVPVIDRLRMTKLETESSNKLKQMGLGIQNFDSAQGALPARVFLQRETGIPRNWCWAILPYMEQSSYIDPEREAYWLKFYVPPGGDPASPLTPYKVFDFENGIFKSPDPPTTHNRSDWTVNRLAESPRGTSNLVFVIEANDPVEWNKPGDIPYDPNGPMPELKPVRRRDGWMALMGDGSTKFISGSVRESTLRAAIDPTSTNLEPLP